MRKSRFLRNSSVPPSSGYEAQNRLSRAGSTAPSRSFRSGSTAPSRDYRAGSSAPTRDYRAGSTAPSRDFRATSYRSSSMAPMRASSIAPSYRASSIAPFRASSIAPMRASSLAPQRISYRASSVTPYSRSYETTRSSYSSPYRASSVAPSARARSYSVGPAVTSTSSFRSTSSSSRPPIPKSTKSYSVDTSIPTRQFGTRLGYSKVETNVKPVIYDEYYGMTYIPSSGRDSWSAYRISDEQLDDNDDLVYESAKRDHDVMKRVNKQIAQNMSAQPQVVVVRPVAVGPAFRRFPPQPVPNVIQYMAHEPEVNMMNANTYKRAPVHVPNTYTVPSPAVQVSYSSAHDGSELLQPRRKALANESVDFNRPTEFKNLKDRLSQARAHLDKGNTSYRSREGDSDLRAIQSEVQAIRNARAARDQSLTRESKIHNSSYNHGLAASMMEDHKSTSDLRKRIRSTLRRTKESRVSIHAL